MESNNKQIVDVRQFLIELREVFDRYDNVKVTSIYEDLYPNKSDIKILFMVGKGEKIGEGGLLQRE